MNRLLSILLLFLCVLLVTKHLHDVPSIPPQSNEVATSLNSLHPTASTTIQATSTVTLSSPTKTALEAPTSSIPNTSHPISISIPVTSPQNSEQGITVVGVISLTNQERETYREAPLTENTNLTRAALEKAHDILVHQYFAHTSPSGIDIETLDKQAGYDYIIIGENLALGPFTTNKEVVDAWMASPEHRANILKPTYQDIGVAVMQGIYQGHEVWVAVQEFGAPKSACPAPSKNLNNTIDLYHQEIASLEQELQAERTELGSISPSDQILYIQKISAYNQTANQANKLIISLKNLVATYNSQVTAFNVCVAEKSNATAP